MKKLKFLATTLLIGVLLFALTACGGVEGTLSDFVNAAKKGDFEKAATYVVGDFDWDDMVVNNDDSVYKYILSKTVGDFEYKVEESNMNSEETTCTVKISYSFHSSGTVWSIYTGINAERSKKTVDLLLKDLDKAEGETTVVLEKNEEGKWLVNLESAASLIALIYM